MSEARITRVEVALQRCYAAWELGNAPSPSTTDLVAAAQAAIGDDTDPLHHGAAGEAAAELHLVQVAGASVREQAEFLEDALTACY